MTHDGHPVLLRRFSWFPRRDINDFTYLLTCLSRIANAVTSYTSRRSFQDFFLVCFVCFVDWLNYIVGPCRCLRCCGALHLGVILGETEDIWCSTYYTCRKTPIPNIIVLLSVTCFKCSTSKQWLICQDCKLQSNLPVQVNPSPVYSGRQVHVKLPGVLAQVAITLQPPLFSSHSSISALPHVIAYEWTLNWRCHTCIVVKRWNVFYSMCSGVITHRFQSLSKCKLMF